MRAGAALEARAAGRGELVEQALLAAQDAGHQLEILCDGRIGEAGRGGGELVFERF